MKAIIMCGGSGSKIAPYHRFWQKSCLPVGNVPNVLRIINQLKAAGIGEITVVVDYLEEQVRYLTRKCSDIELVKAHPSKVAQTLESICEGQQDILVYYGDIYLHENDLKALLESYKEKGNTVLLKTLDEKYKSTDYICADYSGDKVKSFYGHPRGNYGNVKVGGCFAFNGEIAEYFKYDPNTFLNVCVGQMPPSEFFLEQTLNTAMEDGVVFHATFTRHNYVDIDFPWDIMIANQYCCEDECSKLTKDVISESATISKKTDIRGFIKIGKNSVIGDRVVIEGNCIIGDNTVIDNGAIIGANSMIGNSTFVKDYCKLSANTVIGDKNRIGFTAEITGVTFDHVSATHQCEVYGVVGRQTDIAAGCIMGILRFDDLETEIKAPLKKYSGKYTNGIFLGDYMRTGIGNMFAPGVRVGSNSCLGPGLVVSKNVPENKMLLVKQEVVEIDWSSKRYGW